MGKSVRHHASVAQEDLATVERGSDLIYTGEMHTERLRRYMTSRLRLATLPQTGDDGEPFVRDEALASAMEYFGIQPDSIGILEVGEMPPQFSMYANAPVFKKGKPTPETRKIHLPSTFGADDKFSTIARMAVEDITTLPADVIAYITQRCGGNPKGVKTLATVDEDHFRELGLYGDHRYRVDYTNYRFPDPREKDDLTCYERAREIRSRLRQMVESGAYTSIKVRRRAASPNSPVGDEWHLMVYRFAPDPVKHFLRLLYPTGWDLRPKNVRIAKDRDGPPDLRTWEYPPEGLGHEIPYLRNTITFSEHYVALVRRTTQKLAHRYAKVLLRVLPYNDSVGVGGESAECLRPSGVCIEEYVQH